MKKITIVVEDNVSAEEIGKALKNSNVFEDCGNTVSAQDVPLGSIVRFGGLEWCVYGHDEYNTYLISKDILAYMPFSKDEDNNLWETSDIRNEFTKILAEKCHFDKDALASRYTIEKAADGTYENIECKDVVSLLSIDEYRLYRKYIPKVDAFWWTVTADSATNNFVECVDTDGALSDEECYAENGVRPTIWLKLDTPVEIVE